MSVSVNKDGKLVIVRENTTADASETLITTRKMLYDLISERDENHIDDSPIYYGIELLRDLDFTYEEVKCVLNKNSSTKQNQ